MKKGNLCLCEELHTDTGVCACLCVCVMEAHSTARHGTTRNLQWKLTGGANIFNVRPGGFRIYLGKAEGVAKVCVCVCVCMCE
jgi:hypothetical protein